MNFKKEPNRVYTKSHEPKEAHKVKNRRWLDELFNKDWEVFVIKKDQSTGEVTGKIACCALSPV